MKALTALSVLGLCLALAGCGDGHGAEVKAFIDERSGVTAQIAGKVEASPNGAGVDEARKIFEAKKAELSAKRDALKNAKVSFELYQQLLAADGSDRKILDFVRDKKFMELSAEPPALSKYEKLCQDYMNAVGR